MMIDEVKQELDDELTGHPKHVAILMGFETYDEFMKKGWIKTECFEAKGMPQFRIDQVAYNETHPVVVTLEDDLIFRIGKVPS